MLRKDLLIAAVRGWMLGCRLPSIRHRPFPHPSRHPRGSNCRSRWQVSHRTSQSCNGSTRRKFASGFSDEGDSVVLRVVDPRAADPAHLQSRRPLAMWAFEGRLSASDLKRTWMKLPASVDRTSCARQPATTAEARSIQSSKEQ